MLLSKQIRFHFSISSKFQNEQKPFQNPNHVIEHDTSAIRSKPILALTAKANRTEQELKYVYKKK